MNKPDAVFTISVCPKDKKMLCTDCWQECQKSPDGCGTGYATTNDGAIICYACCAKRDYATMLHAGDSRSLPLYWDPNTREVTNWPGSLRYKVALTDIKTGRHNIGRSRTDVWFAPGDGYIWHGVQIGDWNTVCHCKRTRREVAKVAARK